MKAASAKLPTTFGDFIITVYPEERGREPFVLSTPDLDVTKPVLVRIHSECMTGDTLGSYKCDCGPQKEQALKRIAAHKNGMMVYLRQEGRGIGLYQKIKAYKLQEQGLDTHEANVRLGHKPDERDYTIVKRIFEDFGIKEIQLLTNNPSKISQIAELGIDVVERKPIIMETNPHNERYFESKKAKFKHFLDNTQTFYFYGVHGIDSVAQAQSLGEYIENNRSKNPMLRFFLSNETLTAQSLSDEKILSKTEKMFGTIAKYQACMPILHYSFTYSQNPVADLKLIKKYMPYVQHLQLNDLENDFVKTLTYATKYFKTYIGLNDQQLAMFLQDKKLLQMLKKHNVFVILDNSGGKGVKESEAKFKEKIITCINKGINDIVLAGGFGPNHLSPYFAMKDYFKISFSIDAESQLRTNGKFSVKKAQKYIGNLLFCYKN